METGKNGYIQLEKINFQSNSNVANWALGV